MALHHPQRLLRPSRSYEVDFNNQRYRQRLRPVYNHCTSQLVVDTVDNSVSIIERFSFFKSQRHSRSLLRSNPLLPQLVLDMSNLSLHLAVRSDIPDYTRCFVCKTLHQTQWSPTLERLLCLNGGGCRHSVGESQILLVQPCVAFLGMLR
ncbi:hypothetical protein FA15DRAFT_137565 [Coprinopsis marcescibilis]|uniref:Uncharacterized protein n=1 Tax=Coprinopsis marcescibilis TaxID=230819 RepID=A0A5C3KIZ2_COPMA|nr:hypothetical protein FA15DRAFT_137565 [Coprinopsis marcescibilis]